MVRFKSVILNGGASPTLLLD